ncbi:hypothetical protein [Streptomyces sp. NPDC058678]|uniref:hypothetical protein n=1 Tax=Streptomyces sp. NPDC058678 TaxID=3346595 RepID=UPI0036472774
MGCAEPLLPLGERGPIPDLGRVGVNSTVARAHRHAAGTTVVAELLEALDCRELTGVGRCTCAQRADKVSAEFFLIDPPFLSRFGKDLGITDGTRFASSLSAMRRQNDIKRTILTLSGWCPV